MELMEAIKVRKSIRGYKPTPVPKEIITRILEVSTRSQSGMNTQPWEFTVLGGKQLDDLRQASRAQIQAGVPTDPDFPRAPLTGVYRQRQVEVGISIFKLMNIKREDTEKRKEWATKMFGAFDAPNLIMVCLDESLAQNMLMFVSLGAVMHTISLVALEFGLGTCLMGAMIEYPKMVRQLAGIPESKKLVCAIAIGYPDWDFPANKLQSTREPIEKVTTWLGV